MTLRFVGTFAEILGKFPLRLEKFGQKVEIPEAILPDVLGDAGAPLIHESDYAALGVDGKATPEQVQAAQEKYAEWRDAGFPKEDK